MNMGADTKLLCRKWADRLALLMLLVITFAVRCHNAGQIFHDKGVYFVDGDCYSRMTRVKMVSEGHWIIRHHDFENWPLGVNPHTTAPLDWMIVALKPVVGVACKVGLVRNASTWQTQTLDVAGALISPLLGVLTAAWLWWWAGKMGLQFRSAMVLLFALSPIAVHGTVLGRPDHQSLLMFLLAVALGCELWLIRPEDDGKKSHRAWGIAAGSAWGLALWVSLYEPLLLLAPVVVARLLRERKKLLAVGSREEWVAMLGFVLLGLVVDGWRIEMPSAELRENFARWSGTIGELRHMTPADPLLWQWLGLLLMATPVLLCLAGREDRCAFVLLGGFLILFALTMWQRRWGYFLLLIFAVSLPWQLRAFRSTRMAWLAFAIGLWPVGKSWGPDLAHLFHRADESMVIDRAKEDQAWRQLAQTRLRTIAMKMKEGPRTGFIAPWWFSPQVAYWSGQPGVAGTSHQSLPGTLDTARLFLSTDPEKTAEILRRRNVGWVIVDNSADVDQRDRQLAVTNSETLLGVRAAAEPMAFILAEHPRQAPPFLREVRPMELGLVRQLTPKEEGNPQSHGIQIVATQMQRLYRVELEKP
ncbi:MAG: hypothetical protein ABIP20_09160 [Chthoniobacteraceae bacterium]